jgi:anaerobic selenocysteine-containing dehydrogenase
MTLRYEGQFNTVVYDTEDRYRSISGRNVVLMNEKDMATLGVAERGRVTVKNATGTLIA